ncbi:MAG: GNAT family N-acetyltransferase [Muricauda sp.]|nr:MULTISPECIES: GNAT family N-acetyltransferase [unclassified Allomuricauda]MAU16360.1 GNAT family N-acetyltransferase [Allomuricauda sp.]|tara:strand:- start:26785 stop:27870 length:1086 start_codon:yes stop_codon:yes gene_type:complete
MHVIEDRKEWCEIIDQCHQADFYHTFDYHQISKKEGEKPVLLRYSQGTSHILLPLLIRDIEGTKLKDATSVYGYVGPLGKNIGPDFNNSGFKKQLDNFLKENQIISVFSRLHPYISNQKEILKNIGDIVSHGKVVNINLTKSLDEQKQEYKRRLRTYINKESKEYEIIDGMCDTYLDPFIETYCENMKRVKAKPSYFFGKNYFYELLASRQINAELSVAIHKDSGEFAGGAIFTKKGNTIQYHLSGVKSKFFHLNPIKLLIDHARIKGTEEGYTNLNLGGGLGGQEKDSLFYFKSGFSKEHREFNSWQYIVDEPKYNQLLKEKEGLEKPMDKSSCFFPLYRQHMDSDNLEISKINCLANDE